MLNVLPQQLFWLIKRYIKTKTKRTEKVEQFVPTYNSAPDPKARVSLANISEDEIEFITSSNTLRDWASFSLEQRCVYFHRKFPN